VGKNGLVSLREIPSLYSFLTVSASVVVFASCGHVELKGAGGKPIKGYLRSVAVGQLPIMKMSGLSTQAHTLQYSAELPVLPP
jgi:hypothetical protein